MSGRRHGVTEGDRLIGTVGEVRVYVGPDEYDGNERVKIAEPFTVWEPGDEHGEGEWVINLKTYEVRALVRLLMEALDV